MLDSTEDREEAFFPLRCESFETERKRSGRKKLKASRAAALIQPSTVWPAALSPPPSSSPFLLPVCPPDCSPSVYFSTLSNECNPPAPDARLRQAVDLSVGFICNAQVLQVG